MKTSPPADSDGDKQPSQQVEWERLKAAPGPGERSWSKELHRCRRRMRSGHGSQRPDEGPREVSALERESRPVAGEPGAADVSGPPQPEGLERDTQLDTRVEHSTLSSQSASLTALREQKTCSPATAGGHGERA
ncbi:hypothetical protein QTO34_014999 [Cnephaeus nilssonii]|uniref:Uncharacterized protein n=1 Tax=Cnephaeus nilssonii TaxID=3371016 RepID=A0AA40H9V2_CNENI|nr:hypothetical protein QTO34_014999 [Eptesicus nilssonii]